jgi:ribosomal protein S18 acetylase RimI-like enzyme
MGVRMRKMRRPDKPAVMKILETTPEFLPAELPIAEEVIDCYLEDPSGFGYSIIVALVDELVAGYVCYGPAPLTDGTWDIYWMAVTPILKGRGVGRAMLARAEDKISQNAGRLVIIETSSKSNYEKTRRFYLLQGYMIVGTIPDFYAIGDDKVIFSKTLQ